MRKPKGVKDQPKDLSAGSSPRKRIVAGARRHFFAHGLRAVTMDELADELGMSKRTLYAHFPSKTSLVEAALIDNFQEIEAELEGITSESSSDFPAALHRFLACLQRHMSEIQPPFVRDIQREAPEMFKLVESRRRDLVQRCFGRLFSEGRQAAIIREEIPGELLIEILLGALQAVMNPSKMAELGLTPKSGFSAIVKVLLEGVITEQGRSKL